MTRSPQEVPVEIVATCVLVDAVLPRRGHEEDPLHSMRGLLRHGTEDLTDRQQQQILADPRLEAEPQRCDDPLVREPLTMSWSERATAS